MLPWFVDFLAWLWDFKMLHEIARTMELLLKWKNYKKNSRGQSYKIFYTLGQIYKCVLKHENNALAQTFVGPNVRTLYPNIFNGLHFYSGLKRQFRHFNLHRPKV